MNRSTDGGLSQRTNVYAERQMLKHAGPVMVFDKFGMRKEMPKNKGTIISWRRPNVFAAVTTPLQEGVTPNSTIFNYTTVQGTLRPYGQVGVITDVIADTHEDPVLNNLVEQLGENVGRSLEAMDFGALKAGTSVFYANGTARTDVNTPVNNNKLRAVVKFLKAQKAKMITKILDSSIEFSTRGVEAGYVAVCSTDLEPDIRNLVGFLPVAQYGTRKTVHENEFGTVENIRFVTTPDHTPWANGGGVFDASGTDMVTTGGTSADVYPIIIFGMDAYVRVALRGMGAVEPTIIPVNQKTKDDPLGQRGVAGWKTWHLCKIVNDGWITRLEVAATDVNASA